MDDNETHYKSQGKNTPLHHFKYNASVKTNKDEGGPQMGFRIQIQVKNKIFAC